jgi:hypothetical protein
MPRNLTVPVRGPINAKSCFRSTLRFSSMNFIRFIVGLLLQEQNCPKTAAESENSIISFVTLKDFSEAWN